MPPPNTSPGRARVGLVLLALASSLAAPRALGAYSAPLTRVHIDRDRATHTPSLFFASETRDGVAFSTALEGFGAQYVGQLEWASGFGLQLGASAARAAVDLELGAPGGRARTRLETDGWLLGGQARAYWMLWAGPLLSAARPSALTAFVNLRAVHYETSGARTVSGWTQAVQASATTASAGLGVMAELSLTSWFSLCPYAWLSPGLHVGSAYQLGSAAPVAEGSGPSLRQPIRVGVDAWVYPVEGSASHLALSAIASLVDTSDLESGELSLVLGWTF